MRLTAAITRDGDWHVARCLEIEVASQGRSADEALSNLREALELALLIDGPPAAVEPAIIATIELSG
jgi:predicted RNase H-like HicB family nuclease